MEDLSEQRSYVLTTIRTGGTHACRVLDGHFSRYAWYRGYLGEYFSAQSFLRRLYYVEDGKHYGISITNPNARNRKLYYPSAVQCEDGSVKLIQQRYSFSDGVERIEAEIKNRRKFLRESPFSHLFKVTPIFGQSLAERMQKNTDLWAFLTRVGYQPIILKRRNTFAQLFSKVLLWGSRASPDLNTNPIHLFHAGDAITPQPIVYETDHLQKLLEQLQMIEFAEANHFPNSPVLYYEDVVLGKAPDELLAGFGFKSEFSETKKMSVRNRYQGTPRDHIVNYDMMVAECEAAGVGGRRAFEDEFD